MSTPVTQNMAASQIQSSYRRHYSRRVEAATCIHSLYRGRLVRRFKDAVGKGWESKLNEDCAVCMTRFINSNLIENPPVKTLCNHNFHKNCLGSWLKINRTCPLCRIVIKDLNASLRRAIGDGDLAEVTDLIAAGASLEATDIVDSTPLYIAVKEENLEILNVLIRAGANVNEPRRGLGQTTLLHTAIQTEDVGILNALIEANAHIEVRDRWSETPLHCVAKGKSIENMNALIAAAAEIEAEGRWSQTPLHCAAKKGNSEHIRVLLEAGANIEALDQWDKTPLHYASEGNNIENMRALIEAGADVNTVNDERETPLHSAARSGSVDIVSALIKAGAYVNTTNNERETPFNLAMERGHYSCALILFTSRVSSYLPHPAIVAIAVTGAGLYVSHLSYVSESNQEENQCQLQ